MSVVIGEADIEVGADTSNVARDIKAQLGASLAELGRARGNFSGITNDLENATARTRGFGIALTALGAVPSVATLAGLLVNTAGILTALPAAAGIAAGAFATVKIGLSGVSKVFADFDKGNAKAVAKDFQALAPAARPAVRALLDVKTEFRGIKDAVQGALFSGLAGPIRALGATYLPILKGGLSDVASSLNGMIREAIAVARTPFFSGVVSDILEQTSGTIQALTPAVGGLMKVIAALAEAGLPLVGIFTGWISGQLKAAGAFLSSAKGTQFLVTWVDKAEKSVGSIITIFRQLAPVFSTVIPLLSMLGTFFASLPSPVQGLVSRIFLLATVAGFLTMRLAPLITVAGKLAPAIVKLAPALLKVVSAFGMMIVRGAIWAVSMAADWIIAMGPIAWIIAAVVALVVLIVLNWNTVKRVTLMVWKDIAAFVAKAWHDIVAAFKVAWDAISGVAIAIGKAIAAPFVEAFKFVVNFISSNFDPWWKSHGDEIKQLWNELWNGIKSVISGALAVIRAVINFYIAYWEAVWKVFWTVITTVARWAWDVIKPVITAAWQFIVAAFRIYSAIIRGIWNVLWAVMKTVVTVWWTVVSAIVRAGWIVLKTVFTIWITVLVAVWKAAWDILLAVVKAWWSIIRGIIKIGWDVIVGIFNVALDLLTGHWSRAWNDIKRTFGQVWNAIRQALSGAFNAMQHGVSSAIGTLVRAVSGIPGKIMRALGSIGSLLFGAGQKVIQGLINGIMSMLGAAGNAISSVVSTIKSYLPFSPAKTGPLSGAGAPENSGRSIGRQLASGLSGSRKAVAAAMGLMVAGIAVPGLMSPSLGGIRAMSPGSGGGSYQQAVRDGAYAGVMEAMKRGGGAGASIVINAGGAGGSGADEIAQRLRTLSELGVVR